MFLETEKFVNYLIKNHLDKSTIQHSKNVMFIANYFAINKLNLNKEELTTLNQGALLHDIGKGLVDQKILLSKQPLTNSQFLEIKKHPILGYEHAKEFIKNETVLRIILEHHERLNGSGYPNKKTDEEIHYLTKIVSLCDSYDAITQTRTYSKKQSVDFAISEIKKESDVQFDRRLANLFISLLEENKKKGA